MKYFLTTLFIILFYVNGHSQQVKEIRDIRLVNALGNIDTAFFRKANRMVISVYRLSNGPGSANFKESDEVSYNLLISVSEYGEYPNNKVFSVGPFINPVISKEDDLRSEYIFMLEHGPAKNRKVNKALVTTARAVYE